jgi:hypothetical protein
MVHSRHPTAFLLTASKPPGTAKNAGFHRDALKRFHEKCLSLHIFLALIVETIRLDPSYLFMTAT